MKVKSLLKMSFAHDDKKEDFLSIRRIAQARGVHYMLFYQLVRWLTAVENVRHSIPISSFDIFFSFSWI